MADKLPPAHVGIAEPNFCWWCHKKLQKVFKGPTGIFKASPTNEVYFHLVADPMGHQHRVHKACVKNAVAEGNKLVVE
jgi:hypothetical protein